MGLRLRLQEEAAWVHVRFLRNRSPDTHTAAQPDGIPWDRGRPARILPCQRTLPRQSLADRTQPP